MDMKSKLAVIALAMTIAACGADGGAQSPTGNGTNTGNGDNGTGGSDDTGNGDGGNNGGGTDPANSGDPQDTSGAETASNPEDIASMVCDNYVSGIVTTFESGNLCELEAIGVELCGVNNGELAADADAETLGTIFVTAALLDPAAVVGGVDAQVGLTVDLPGPILADNLAAFEIEVPGGTADIDVLSNINITTFMNGVALETTDAAAASSLDGVGLINVDLLTLIPGAGRFLAGFVASQDYNQIQINLGATVATVDLGDTVNVHDVCTSASAAAAAQ